MKKEIVHPKLSESVRMKRFLSPEKRARVNKPELGDVNPLDEEIVELIRSKPGQTLKSVVNALQSYSAAEVTNTLSELIENKVVKINKLGKLYLVS
jgi:flagellar motor switch protein FliG